MWHSMDNLMIFPLGLLYIVLGVSIFLKKKLVCLFALFIGLFYIFSSVIFLFPRPGMITWDFSLKNPRYIRIIVLWIIIALSSILICVLERKDKYRRKSFLTALVFFLLLLVFSLSYWGVWRYDNCL